MVKVKRRGREPFYPSLHHKAHPVNVLHLRTGSVQGIPELPHADKASNTPGKLSERIWAERKQTSWLGTG